MTYGGIWAPKYVILKIRLIRIQRTHLPNYEFRGHIARPETLFCGKTSFVKIYSYEQKMQLKVGNFKNLVSSKILSQCFRWRRGGIQAQNFFILEIRLLLYFKHTFAKLWFLTTNAAPCSTIVRWHHFLCKNTAFISGEEKKKCHSVNAYTHESRRSSKNSNALLNLSVHHCCFEKMPAKAAGRGITSYI